MDILWNYTLVFVNLSSGQDALYVLMRLREIELGNNSSVFAIGLCVANYSSLSVLMPVVPQIVENAGRNDRRGSFTDSLLLMCLFTVV